MSLTATESEEYSQSSQSDSDLWSDSDSEGHVHTRGEFFGCYLLISQNSKYRGQSYIGFTVDPNRRLKQHNQGRHKGGARKTSGKGPWEMVLIIHGFPNNISALRFEWAWQNPGRSRRLGKTFARKKRTESFLQYRFRVVTEMLSVGPWKGLPLTIRWLKQEYKVEFPPDKQPPIHMPLAYGLIGLSKAHKTQSSQVPHKTQPSQVPHKTQPSQVPHKTQPSQVPHSEPSPNMDVCGRVINGPSNCQICNIENNNLGILQCYHRQCSFSAHVTCLATKLLSGKKEVLLIPVSGLCPKCDRELLWGELVRKFKEQTG